MLGDMTSIVQSEILPRPSQDAQSSPETQAAAVVLAYLDHTQLRFRSKAYEVLGELAKQTIARLEAAQPPAITTLNLKTGVAPDAAKEPSAWLSPHWNKLMMEEQKWQEGMSSVARRIGASFVPKLEKLTGNPTMYRIVALPLPDDNEEADVQRIPDGGVFYTPESIAAPGAWLRVAWKAGIVRWTAATRWSIGFLIFAGLIFVAVVGWLLLDWASRVNRPVSLADVATMICFGAMVAAVSAVFRFWGQLFDMRIVMAPSLLTPLSKDNVTLELRPSSIDSPGELVFARYTSTCPICGGGIQLYEGGKGFPDRIVGRCKRSGREHVFSFDHVLKVGHRL